MHRALDLIPSTTPTTNELVQTQRSARRGNSQAGLEKVLCKVTVRKVLRKQTQSGSRNGLLDILLYLEAGWESTRPGRWEWEWTTWQCDGGTSHALSTCQNMTGSFPAPLTLCVTHEMLTGNVQGQATPEGNQLTSDRHGGEDTSHLG